MIPFQEFAKIPRLKRGCFITEKIDGTNGVIHFDEDGNMLVGSRTRWITPEQDNYGFARWAYENKVELAKLGPGFHYGEWWGAGIQRRYGLTEKRFSLFNVGRWTDDVRPACCGVVPILYHGDFTTTVVDECLETLRSNGSVAAPGFMKPEGVVIYLTAAGAYFKRTIEKDEKPKGKVA
jgi:hypothetical protein